MRPSIANTLYPPWSPVDRHIIRTYNLPSFYMDARARALYIPNIVGTRERQGSSRMPTQGDAPMYFNRPPRRSNFWPTPISEAPKYGG